MTPQQQNCARYVELFENLTPERLDELASLLTEAVHFRDPFNDVRGIAAMRAVMADMFERTEAPRFRVLHWCVDECQGYIRWHFSARVPLLGDWDVEGLSRLLFAPDGRIIEHLDYWDSGPLYERVPLFGRLIRLIRRRMSAHSRPGDQKRLWL